MGRKKADNNENVAVQAEREGNDMSQETTQETMQEEMQQTEMNGQVHDGQPAENQGDEAATATAAPEKVAYFSADGTEISMSQFIREKFNAGMSRKEISDTFKINYRTVYGATVNLDNGVETSRGRSAVNAKIRVTEDNRVLIEKTTREGEGEAAHDVTTYYVNGEAVTAEVAAEVFALTKEVDRNEWIKAVVAAGVNRADVAKALDLSYGVIYGLTKEETSGRQKYEVEIDDPENPGEKKTISRNEYIRMRAAAGVSKADIAKELGVEYTVVWQATKKEKTDAEKYTDILESLEKFADKMVEADVANFKAYIEALKLCKVKVEEEKKEEKKEETTPAETETAPVETAE